MKLKIKYKSLLFILCLWTSTNGYAQEVSKVLDLKEPGTLSYYITDADKSKITKLTVTGDLNGNDIKFIREMGGRDSDGNPTGGTLTTLDLSEANIVKGGDYYYSSGTYAYLATDNKIGILMFNQCNFTSVIIPNSVTAIGENAFAGCEKLTSITIHKNVTNIDEGVFVNCTSLKEILVSEDNPDYCSFQEVLFNKDKTVLIAYPNAKSARYSIPDHVTSIGDYAFGGCSGLTSVIFSKNLTKIGNWAFAGCSGLDVLLLGKVNSLGDAPFANCTNLTEFIVTDGNSPFTTFNGVLFNKDLTTLVAYPNARSADYTIPDNVTNIGRYAFAGCTGLNSVTIPEDVKSMDEFAFYGCSGLTSVTLPSSITSIGKQVFQSCTGLTSVNIPASVTSIGEGAFYNCTGLTAMTFPTSVTSIAGHAFQSCTGLTSVTLPSGLKSIDTHVFADCTKLTTVTIPTSVTDIAGYAFYGCTGMKSIKIPEGVVNVAEGAFGKCINLATFKFPDSMASVGDFAFYKTAWYEGQKDGVVYANRVLYYHKGMPPAKASIVIKEGTVSISNNAFQGCSTLAAVTIPGSVKHIGIRAFGDCNGLKTLTIPAGVTSIGEQAFYGILGVKELYSLNTTPPACGANCFFPNDALLIVPTGSKSVYQQANEWSNFKEISEKNFTSISEYNQDWLKVYSLSGKIIIENLTEGKTASITNIAGRLVYQGTDREIAVEDGTYIISVDKATRKVIVD